MNEKKFFFNLDLCSITGLNLYCIYVFDCAVFSEDHLCVFIYVCVQVCTCVCEDVSVYACVHANAYVCANVHICMCVYFLL